MNVLLLCNVQHKCLGFQKDLVKIRITFLQLLSDRHLIRLTVTRSLCHTQVPISPNWSTIMSLQHHPLLVSHQRCHWRSRQFLSFRHLIIYVFHPFSVSCRRHEAWYYQSPQFSERRKHYRYFKKGGSTLSINNQVRVGGDTLVSYYAYVILSGIIHYYLV